MQKKSYSKSILRMNHRIKQPKGIEYLGNFVNSITQICLKVGNEKKLI